MKPKIKVEKWHIIDDILYGFTNEHPKSLGTNTSIKSSKIINYRFGEKEVETKNTIYILGEESAPYLGEENA